MVSGGDFVGIFHSAEQLKADRPVALPANGKPVAGQQRGFMHQAMLVMSDAVNAAFWDQISGPMLPFQNCLPLVRPEREHAILKTSKVADKARIENSIHNFAKSSIPRRAGSQFQKSGRPSRAHLLWQPSQV